MMKSYLIKLLLSSVLYLTLFIFTIMSCSKPYANREKQIARKCGHLFISHPKQSFGTIKQHDKQIPSCSFILKNTGEEIINIKNIDVSCGCLSTELSSTKVNPGKSIILKVIVNPSKQIGYFNKSIFVNSDADNALEILRIKGTIIQ